MFQTIKMTSRIVFWEQNVKTGALTLSGDWKNFCGWEIEELIDKDLTTFLSPDEAQTLAVRNMKKTVIAAGKDESRGIVVKIRCKDGSFIWIQDICYVSERDADDTPCVLTGVLQDITHVRKTIDSVHRKQENLDLVADIAKLSYWQWNADTDVLIFSPQFELVTGFTPQEIRKAGISKSSVLKGEMPEKPDEYSWFWMIHPDDRGQFKEVITSYLYGQVERYHIEVRVREKRGGYIWVVNAGYVAERDSNGALSIVRGAIINIDESKRAELRALENAALLERTKEHMDIVAEMSHLAFFEWDIENDRLTCSLQFMKEFGYEEGMITSFGKVPRENPVPPYQYIELIHPDDLHKRNENLEACLKGTASQYNTNLRLKRADGEYMWTKASGHVVEWKNGIPAKIMGGIINVNELRRAETLNRAKSAFLARMSHEIRTPMNAITGMSELILRENIPPRAREYANGVKQASANLLSLINDILDFSKIEAGSLEIINTSYLFASLVNDVVNIIRMRMREKPLAFTVNIDSTIPQKLTGDVVRIRQVLLNLLNNAVKYTEKGYIALDISGCYSGNDTDKKDIQIIMKVSDSGMGIKPEDTGRLFGEFVQVDVERNRHIEGSGLGLAIARNLARAMAGDITLESEYGRGSCFTFSLPQTVEDAQCVASVENAGDKSVLIYEARERYANSIKRSLDDLRVPCTMVSNYAQLKEKLAEKQYPWLFAASPLYESAHDLIRKTNAHTKIVALGEEAASDIAADITIPMPAHAISIANTLNNRRTEVQNEGERHSLGFVAPTARVLIIDDILTNLVVAEGLLAPYQMRVNTCLSGGDALSLIKELAQKDEYFDGIFIDHMMPGMDGIETAQAIRALAESGFGEVFATVPLVAFTANAIIGMREIFLENGFTDYIVKPIDIKKLDESLRSIIPPEKQQIKPQTPENDDSDKKNISNIVQEISCIDGIDMQTALSHVRTEANLITVLRQFIAEFDGYINGIQTALRDEDWYEYTLKVHAIKGVLATIGNTALSQAARELELAAREERYELCRQKTDALCAAVAGFYTALQKSALVCGERAQDTPQERTAVGGTTFRKKLQALYDAAFRFNSDEAEQALGLISRVEPEDAALKARWEKALPAIRANIEGFNYDEAAGLVKALLDESIWQN
ncbi:MAG: PAS domain-containing protein [Spirochaetaceae bacterium]|jgi:PAS domain S-box-containing protein|nr:PAS domain-containing protein [Spirochaetaceae bacterium]